MSYRLCLPYQKITTSVAYAKESARNSGACMKAPSEEIYGKSTQGTMEYNAEKYIQCVTTLSLTIRLAVVASQSAKFREIR